MTVRNQKIEARIQRLVAEALTHEVSDPRLAGLLSVTRVQITQDLRDARVFISVLSSRPDQTVQQGLNSAQKRLQRHVAEGLTMKFAPRLTFHLDKSLKKQAEILALVDKATTGQDAESAAGTVLPTMESRTEDDRRNKHKRNLVAPHDASAAGSRKFKPKGS